MAWRPRRFSDSPAQPALEPAQSLALSRTDAQHQGRRARCRPAPAPIFLRADAVGSSLHRAHLADRIVCPPLFRATQALPHARLGLSNLLHGLLRPSRKELL